MAGNAQLQADDLALGADQREDHPRLAGGAVDSLLNSLQRMWR